jgi:protein SCO1/2
LLSLCCTVALQKFLAMKKMWVLYVGSFILLLTGFYFLIFKNVDFSRSNLPVINSHVQAFSFINQDGKTITEKNVEGKVYVTEYFFTTCKAICPKMNANMRRVFDEFKDEKNFIIISHTCMPEVDSVPLLKAYEQKMINGNLVQALDGSYKIQYDSTIKNNEPDPNWDFVTGDKATLYRMARHSYLLDDNKSDTTENIADQFIHTQLFALVDKQRRVRGIYDGLKEEEIQKLLTDIKSLLNERPADANLANGFSNTPN